MSLAPCGSTKLSASQDLRPICFVDNGYCSGKFSRLQQAQASQQNARLLSGIAGTAQSRAHWRVGSSDPGRTQLGGNRRQGRYQHGRDASVLDEPLQNHGRAVTTPSASGEQDGIRVHFAQARDHRRPQSFAN